MKRLRFALVLSCTMLLSCESSDGRKIRSEKDVIYRQAYEQGHFVGQKIGVRPFHPPLPYETPNFTWGAHPDFANIRQKWMRGFDDGTAGSPVKP